MTRSPNDAPLRPRKDVTRCLLSTSARFVGQLDSKDLLITHAWPELMSPNPRRTQLQPGPTHRTFLVASFATDDVAPEDQLTPLTNHHWRGDLLAVSLTAFFGKRVDHHGLTETHGHFCLPAYDAIREISTYRLPAYNTDARVDLGIRLDLSELRKIVPVLRGEVDDKALNCFFTAGRFYLRSLQLIEDQPEMAYIDLVTAGEVLSNYYPYEDEELFDEGLLQLLDEIRHSLQDGEKKSNRIKSRLYQVRRRFGLAMGRLLNSNFFKSTESSEPGATLEADSIESTLLAAYDLRSRYVHTGERFGVWIRMLDHFRLESMVGEPNVTDKELKKTLMRAPTFIGLERILRYCLLAFVHQEVCPFDGRLEPDGQE